MNNFSEIYHGVGRNKRSNGFVVFGDEDQENFFAEIKFKKIVTQSNGEQHCESWVQKYGDEDNPMTFNELVERMEGGEVLEGFYDSFTHFKELHTPDSDGFDFDSLEPMDIDLMEDEVPADRFQPVSDEAFDDFFEMVDFDGGSNDDEEDDLLKEFGF